LGVVYVSGSSLSGVANADELHRQNAAIMTKNLALPPWRVMPGIRNKVAMKFIGIGYHFARKNQIAEARHYFLAAWRLDPLSLSTTRTLVYRGLLGVRAGLG
jgi:hypothetical protein